MLRQQCRALSRLQSRALPVREDCLAGDARRPTKGLFLRPIPQSTVHPMV